MFNQSGSTYKSTEVVLNSSYRRGSNLVSFNRVTRCTFAPTCFVNVTIHFFFTAETSSPRFKVRTTVESRKIAGIAPTRSNSPQLQIRLQRSIVLHTREPLRFVDDALSFVVLCSLFYASVHFCICESIHFGTLRKP